MSSSASERDFTLYLGMLDLLKQSAFTSMGLACLAREELEQPAAEVDRDNPRPK
jgi:hypothetical protein